MTILTIVIPLAAFAIAVFWMIHQGNEAKKQYLLRRKIEEENRIAAEKLGAYPSEVRPQSGGAADAAQERHQNKQEDKTETAVGSG
jgi:hypothetical protein